MNERKIIYILGSLLIIASIAIAFLIGKDFGSNKNITDNQKESNGIIESNNNQNNDESKKTNNEPTTNVTTPTTPQTTTYTKVDNDVIDEVESIEVATEKILEEDSKETALKKAKSVFVKLVDFAFYDGEINGHTFSELSNKGKESVLALINKLDEKIEAKYPGYKESISSSTSEAYKKASELIKEGATNLDAFSREKLGEDNYNSIINAKDKMVDYYKENWPTIKEKSENVATKAKDKIKNWYENFRNN